ncbi:hypothetical protein M758_3G144300 [Ceratodon purpureus]|nr:hypothetical protein M758_3G144300 [Ceratodon purpureus]
MRCIRRTPTWTNVKIMLAQPQPRSALQSGAAAPSTQQDPLITSLVREMESTTKNSPLCDFKKLQENLKDINTMFYCCYFILNNISRMINQNGWNYDTSHVPSTTFAQLSHT